MLEFADIFADKVTATVYICGAIAFLIAYAAAALWMLRQRNRLPVNGRSAAPDAGNGLRKPRSPDVSSPASSGVGSQGGRRRSVAHDAAISLETAVLR